MIRLARGLLCAALAATSSLSIRAQERRARNPQIETLIADARAVAPEFSADALIRIAGSSQIDDARRRELLDEAFLRAYGARDDHRLGSALEIPQDSKQGALRLAYATSLNRLSLQVRAAQMMASIDPLRAREIFEWIELNLAPATCDSLLVPSVDEYYTALSLLARTTFADRAEGFRFLELYLWRAHLPSEMPAVARAVQRFRPKRDEAAYLESALGWILDRASTDARGFSNAGLELVTRMSDLQKADRESGLSSWHLMEVLRAYLVTQLNGPWCSDSVLEPMTAPAFNGELQRLGADLDVKPIDARAIRPSKILAGANLDLYWQTPESRRLHEDWLQLRGRERAPVPLATRLTTPWRNQAERFLAAVEQWTGAREAERDYVYQKGVLLTGLIDMMPPSPARTRAVRAFVEFMRHADGDRNLRALWFAFLNRFLDSARGPDRRELLAALEESRQPVLSLYARLERMLGSRSRGLSPSGIDPAADLPGSTPLDRRALASVFER